MVNTYKERARRGAIRFDEIDPSWYTKVDEETLDMSEQMDCVYAQISGKPFSGSDLAFKLDPSVYNYDTKKWSDDWYKNVINHGFALISHGLVMRDGCPRVSMKLKHRYDKLTEAWIEEIRKRKMPASTTG